MTGQTGVNKPGAGPVKVRRWKASEVIFGETSTGNGSRLRAAAATTTTTTTTTTATTTTTTTATATTATTTTINGDNNNNANQRTTTMPAATTTTTTATTATTTTTKATVVFPGQVCRHCKVVLSVQSTLGHDTLLGQALLAKIRLF